MAASELVLEIYKKETFVHVFFFFLLRAYCMKMTNKTIYKHMDLNRNGSSHIF